jgi:hypothetical protein
MVLRKRDDGLTSPKRVWSKPSKATLLAGGPDAYSGGEGLAVEPLDRYENTPGGYRRQKPDDYNKGLPSIQEWPLILSSPRNQKSGSVSSSTMEARSKKDF